MTTFPVIADSGTFLQPFTDSAGATQTVMFTSYKEKHELWVTLWAAYLGVIKAVLIYHPTMSRDKWPDGVGGYELATSALEAIRTPPPFLTGPSFISDATDAWMPDITGTMRKISFASGAQMRTCWREAWSFEEGSASPAEDFDSFPPRNGTYEHVLSVLAGL